MIIKKYFFIIIISCLLFQKNASSKDYIFKWFNNVQVLDSIEFIDKSKYQLTLAEGSWEDNEGNYGFLKCLGPVKINSKGEATLEALCKGFDHLENKFSVKLIRRSDYDVGIGETIYISGEGRYKSLVDRKCKYAIKYIKEVTKGFYRHICK
mgnify:CR=1 FL=1